MEVSFLTSSSFTLKAEMNQTIRAGNLIYANPKKHSHLAQRGQVAFPLSLKSCHLSSSSPGFFDKSSSTNSRRSLRAKLAATVQQSTAEDSAIGVDSPSPNVIPELEKGGLLIATEKLNGDPFYERAVVLLVGFTEESGPYGIILNKPPFMSLKQAGLANDGPFANSPLFIGGPIGGSFWALASPEEGNEDELVKSEVFQEVTKGLYFGPKGTVTKDEMKRMMDRAGDIRFFDGYCGWERKRLLKEIKDGYWTVAASSPSVVQLGSVGNVGLRDELLGLVGLAKVG